MDFRFVSNKPWVDETVRLRKTLFFTTLIMAILGVILAIIGIVLIAYMEFVVGVVAIIFGILIPLGYLGANVLLFARRRKSYDKNMIVEYHFTEDALEIIRLSDNFKSKNVIDYSSFSVNKVYNKSRFLVLKTKSYYSDVIVIRKKDIVLGEGDVMSQAIVSFVSFLMAKVAEANRAIEVTCQDTDTEALEQISGQNSADSDENIAGDIANVDTSSVEIEDFTESDDVDDIVDESNDIEPSPTVCRYDVVEEDVALESDTAEVIAESEGEPKEVSLDEDDTLDDNVADDVIDDNYTLDDDVADNVIDEDDTLDNTLDEDSVEDDIVDDITVDDDGEGDRETLCEEMYSNEEMEHDSLFDYGERIVTNDDLVSKPHEDNNYFHDYSYRDDEEDKA